MSEYYFRVSELINKERIGTISEEEKAELVRWLEEAESHRVVYERILNGSGYEQEYRGYQSVSAERVWKNIRRLERQNSYFRLRYWGVAAAVVVFLAVGGYLFIGKGGQPEMPLVQALSYDSIHSGERKAILELADGQRIVLQDADIRLKTEVAAIRQVDNELRYIADSLPAAEKLNVLTTPRGGEFNVTLSDGTRVWLNAGSQLIFPEVFVKGVREVRLTGEAYFEVAKVEGKPFMVRAGEMNIRVLGTHFNVKAFPEEGRMVTTLAEGAVELYAGGCCAALKPGEQGEYVAGGKDLAVREVDAGDYMAWKDGKFVFRRERLESIMDAVARWYNVEVFYAQQEVGDILFSGKMDRYGHVRELLDMLEKTGKVAFDLNDRGLIVRAK